jgi:hypothetical protein
MPRQTPKTSHCPTHPRPATTSPHRPVPGHHLPHAQIRPHALRAWAQGWARGRVQVPTGRTGRGRGWRAHALAVVVVGIAVRVHATPQDVGQRRELNLGHHAARGPRPAQQAPLGVGTRGVAHISVRVSARDDGGGGAGVAVVVVIVAKAKDFVTACVFGGGGEGVGKGQTATPLVARGSATTAVAQPPQSLATTPAHTKHTKKLQVSQKPGRARARARAHHTTPHHTHRTVGRFTSSTGRTRDVRRDPGRDSSARPATARRPRNRRPAPREDSDNSAAVSSGSYLHPPPQAQHRTHTHAEG